MSIYPNYRRAVALLVYTAWLQAASSTLRAAGLIASDGAANDFFGNSLSVSGSIALVSNFADDDKGIDSGTAYVFRDLATASGIITQNVKLTASDGAAQDYFGLAVGLSGSTAIIGAFADDVGGSNAGSAYIFRALDTASGTITQDFKLNASDPAALDNFGISVGISGATAIVGAHLDDDKGTNSGSAYIFRGLNTGSGNRTQNAKLVASDGAAGDNFGREVAISGNTAIVGAYLDDDKGTDSGSAYVYRGLDVASATINQSVKLTAADGAAGDNFGRFVAISGATAIVGAQLDDDKGTDSGSAYVYRGLDTASGTINQSVKLTASDGAAGDNFGAGVAVSGNTGIVGAFQDDDNGSDSGSAYIFRALDTASGTITQSVKLMASDGAASDNFGVSVGIDGDNFLVGAAMATGTVAKSGKAYSGSVSSVTTLDTGNTSKVISGISFVSQDDWIIGQTTDANQVTLSASDAATVSAAGKAVLIGRDTGSDNNRLILSGTLTATQVTIGATAGTTGNRLEVTTTGSLNATAIRVNNGGTLLLSGANTDTDRIGNGAAITLASGGTLATGGWREGTSTTGSTAGVGALTLTGGATIDFGTGANGSVLLAASGLVTGAGTISILNWSGTAGTDSGAAGNDRLLFVANPPFDAAQLAQFQFFNDTGVAFGAGGMEVSYNGFTEIVPTLTPVPEPATWLGALALAGLLGYRERRRLASLGRDCKRTAPVAQSVSR